MTVENENKLLLLKKSLQNMAKPFKEQLAIFPEFVDVVDEVISDFDNAFRLLPALMEEKAIPYDAVKEILKCNNIIVLNLSIDGMQTDEKFEFDSSWNLLREYAYNALNQMP
jgi:hypothetical protein